MTRYLYHGPFMSPPPNKKYLDNYDKVFGKEKKCVDCGKKTCKATNHDKKKSNKAGRET